MLATTEALSTFPIARIRSRPGVPPIEVALIAQLGHGSGDPLIEAARMRQSGHEAFIDALDEPSARIGGIDVESGDTTSLYTFTVGAAGHPFHRHAGHRVFTAISGSAGAQLRFSTASSEQIARDPSEFISALHHVNIPPDCLFTARFGGGTWHQFVPLQAGSAHPALFALSCHTNELGGDLAPELRRAIIANEASIPALTEVLPAPVRALLEGASFDPARVATIALSLDAAPTSRLARACASTRRALGRARAFAARWRRPRGFLAASRGACAVRALAAMPAQSLLHEQLDGRDAHDDAFELRIAASALGAVSARVTLAAILAGFVENHPSGVRRLMSLRNVLVAPFGLRTSPLGCPVSSLLSRTPGHVFAGRFPVFAQRLDAADTWAEVVLGADDRHVAFRTCVAVELRDGEARCLIGTRVNTRNVFGDVYMAMVDPVHRRYITPALLRHAIEHVARRAHGTGE